MKLTKSFYLKILRHPCIKSIIVLILYSTAGELYGGDIPPDHYSFQAGASIRLLKNTYFGTIPFSTFGLHGTFPVQPDKISIRFGAEYGLVPKKGIVQKTDILLTEITLFRKFFLYGDILTINPCLSLVNCALHLAPKGDARDALIINSWENEFGSGFGCDIAAQYKFFTFSIPLSASLFFTDKSAFVVSSGIKAGITLHPESRSRP